MNLRLPKDLEAPAKLLAERERRSLHSLVVKAVDEYVARHGDREEIVRIGSDLVERYADALDRLGKS